MFGRVSKLLIVVVILASVSGCPTPEDQTAHIIERGSSQGRPFTRELPFSNCSSEEHLQTTQPVDEKFEHKVEIVRAPNSKANPAELAKAVRRHYLCPEDERCSPPLVAIASYPVVANVPPGFVFTYVIEWTETWREGDIEIGEIDDNPEATFKFLESLTGGVVDIKTAACP
jgi:hypothetical protein